MSENLSKRQGIYISIDALLDTRLATIFQYNEELVAINLNNGYLTRETDNFTGLDFATFKLKYAKRDKLTLKNSVVTKTINMIKELVVAMVKQSVTTPLHTGPKIYLNTFPYKLTTDEENIFIRAIAQLTGKLADIEIVHMSNHELTPSFLKENLALLFMYEYGEWLDLQAKNFKTLPCPEVCVIVPAIYFDRKPTEEELTVLVEKNMTPFKAVEFLSASMIGLKLHEVELFCANIK